MLPILALAAALTLQGATPTPSSRLVTRWARAVSPDSVLPESPRPQLVRRDWRNLNGVWRYAIRDRVAPRPGPEAYSAEILVPFPIESQLSGVTRSVTETQRVWYRRTFRAPARRPGNRLLLHFGAVDWEAIVYVNGQRVGEHRGGYDPFTFDITATLRPGADALQELVVGVWDPTDRGPQPRGKQVLKPEGIWYTAVTGIWQTVWLEPVPRGYIADLTIVPDLDSGLVTLRVRSVGTTARTRLYVTAVAGDGVVAQGEGPVDSAVTVRIPEARAWSPDDPFLYGLRVRLSSGDSVASYFGMRKIAMARDSVGVLRLFLNNRPLFQYGMLDQGWWPDGLYTAPTDEALRFDLETMQRLGFNLVRKHVKVEPARWYHHADRLGMLVWQDMPSGDNDTPAGREDFASELQAVVDALRNHPSIVMWVPFNEGWGQHDTESYVRWLESYDPTRLVNNASGWTDARVGDVADVHAYPGPGMPPPDSTRAPVLGEFGGLGLPLAGHTWLDENNWGYVRFTSAGELGAAYRALLHQLRFLIADGLSAAVYTQTTDVESEVNGLMTYDRDVVKLPPEATADHRLLYGPPPAVRTVVPSSQKDGQRWRFTTQAPDSGWYRPDHDDGAWSQGVGGFGKAGTPGAVVRTAWETPDIWLRRTFDVSSWPLLRPHWRLHHDEDAEVYLNGELVGRFAGWTAGYFEVPLDARARAALLPGTNTLALRVHQTGGGQYADIGLDELLDPVEGDTNRMERASVTRAPFGTLPDGRAVEAFTLTNAHGLEVRAITYGGIIVSLRAPDRAGHLDDVVLGYDSLDGYLRSSPYFGAIVGRYGNRIAGGRFKLDGRTYKLARNNGPNHLHGGIHGFDKVVWQGEPFQSDSGVGVVFSHTSPDKDEGYPGTLAVRVSYTLTGANELIVDYHATTDKATPVNLTQHSYFNLGGRAAGDVLGHQLLINADRYTPVDATLIPTGALAPVAGTPFDFRTPTTIGARIEQPDEQLRNGKGYDHNFVLNRGGRGAGLVHAARVEEPTSGRTLDVYTTEPGMQ